MLISQNAFVVTDRVTNATAFNFILTLVQLSNRPACAADGTGKFGRSGQSAAKTEAPALIKVLSNFLNEENLFACGRDFRSGSFTSFRSCVPYFRFSPISRHFVAAQYLSRWTKTRTPRFARLRNDDGQISSAVDLLKSIVPVAGGAKAIQPIADF